MPTLQRNDPRAGPEPQHPEDEEGALLARIADKDRNAFDTLYRAYYRRLMRFLMRMLSHTHDAEEALNETMLVVWSRAASFHAGSRVSTWIFGIAYRQALNVLKKTRNRTEPLTEAAMPAVEDDGEASVYRQETGAQLARALRRLSPEQRAVVELTYYGGYSYPEIAEIVGCPQGTVKTRMLHARRKLKRHLHLDRVPTR